MTDNGKDEQDESTELAEERTEWAEDRTVLAVERTYAGWLRTAFAAIGIGLGFRAVFGEFEPPWLARAIATMFIILGAVFAISAERRARDALARLQAHAVDPPDALKTRWIAWAIAGGAIVLIVGLWVMNDGNLTDGS